MKAKRPRPARRPICPVVVSDSTLAVAFFCLIGVFAFAGIAIVVAVAKASGF